MASRGKAETARQRNTKSVKDGDVPLSTSARTAARAQDSAARIKNTLSVTIVRIAEIINRSTTRNFGTRYNLKNADFQIMVNLSEPAPVTIGELSRRTRLDKAWISRSLGGLIERGLIQISTDPDRPRAKLISLTDAGTAMLAEIAPEVAANAKKFIAGVDHKTAEVILSRILANAIDIEEADLASSRANG